ncbi:MAG TPA: Holliday junction branch migration DNA helicase RuvB [Candidatus Tyrphobacter sp.]|nr:Holliday junction branch migration DNA helicase RuvB [Candidatus Tyrphobacter sp.]
MSKNNLEDQTLDSLLRPNDWGDYIGQANVKKNLGVIIEAAEIQKEPVDHLLFYGQAGLGKTTLAVLVAKRLKSPIKITSGAALEKAGDLVAILSNLTEGEILFIDEAHRLNPSIEEILYPAMESRRLHIVIGKGVGARTLSLDLPPFTLIAATTRASLLSSPLRSRFGAAFHLDFYTEEDVKKIIGRSADLLGLKILPEAVDILAKASRLTPRTANRLLRRARDYMVVNKKKVLDERAASESLKLLDLDSLGLERAERALLKTIISKFNGGPVGLNTLSATIGEDRETIENVFEPYLLKIGFIKRLPTGRVIQESALEHLAKEEI